MHEKHFSEADLLETYYTQPGESMPVMMHLADCEDCASRYEKLERKIRGTRTCHTESAEQPETFWTRQRLSIMRRVEQQKQSTWTMAQTMRIAAVAVFAFVLGGVATYRTIEPAATTTVPVATAAIPASTASTEMTIPTDPWESEELDEFHSMVDWESWGDPKS